MSLCACGCGKEVKDGNNYIHGHNRKGLSSYTSGDRWSVKYDRCVVCGTTNYPHNGKGLCVKCYKVIRYKAKKNNEGKWSRKYDECIKCGTNVMPHKAKGLCTRCYENSLNRKKGKKMRNFGAWSWYYDKCKKCGTTKVKHAKDGLCINCYDQAKRELSECFPCPVCGVMVKNINQHLSMKSKTCKKHEDYQRSMFKQYFDSDL